MNKTINFTQKSSPNVKASDRMNKSQKYNCQINCDQKLCFFSKIGSIAFFLYFLLLFLRVC